MNIKKYRVDAKLTQAELGIKVGAKQSTVSLWENGQRNPHSTTLPKLAKALSCSIDDLFSK